MKKKKRGREGGGDEGGEGRGFIFKKGLVFGKFVLYIHGEYRFFSPWPWEKGRSRQSMILYPPSVRTFKLCLHDTYRILASVLVLGFSFFFFLSFFPSLFFFLWVGGLIQR